MTLLHGATLVELPGGGRALDGKESTPNLFVPEDKNAVAHGDQTLDVLAGGFPRTSTPATLNVLLLLRIRRASV